MKDIFFVSLSTGDTAAILGSTVLLAADPALDDTNAPEEVATKLAKAMGGVVTRISMDPPAMDDWNWDHVVAALPPLLPSDSREDQIIGTLREEFARTDAKDLTIVLEVNQNYAVNASFSRSEAETLTVEDLRQSLADLATEIDRNCPRLESIEIGEILDLRPE